jgi:DNA-binding transcriptional LysR family regulator
VLNFSEIQVFAVSAETGSFSKAARRLHVSQPAVSQQIRSLERSLSTRLFQRSNQGVMLTNAGRVLLPMARELLSLSCLIQETMGALEEHVTDLLTVGCAVTTGKMMLPLVIAAFNQHFPDVQVTVEMSNCDSVEDALLAQDIHLGISGTEAACPMVECQAFFTDHVILVVPPDHPFAQRSSVRPDQLIGQLFILHDETCSIHQMIQEELAEQGISVDQLRVAMIAESVEAIGVAVEHGLGIAFTCRLAARHGLRSGNLVEVPVEGVRLERPLYLLRNTRSPTTVAQGRFWDFVSTHQAQISRALNA